MDDVVLTPWVTPELKLWILVGVGVILIVLFAWCCGRMVVRLDPPQPDFEDDAKLRRAMHLNGGASVETEITDEVERVA